MPVPFGDQTPQPKLIIHAAKQRGLHHNPSTPITPASSPALTHSTHSSGYQHESPALLHDAERAIFDRVLDLGWTPERFKAIDSRRGQSDDEPVERFGRKYQWIGFYEVLGRITDNHDASPSWDSTQPQP